MCSQGDHSGETGPVSSNLVQFLLSTQFVALSLEQVQEFEPSPAFNLKRCFSYT